MTYKNNKKTVLGTQKNDHTKEPMFLSDNSSLGMQRFDTLKYKQFDKITDKQLGFFWRPEEVDITRDSKDFKDLSPHEQHIFTSNLKRQILLDSVQGRSPNLAFLPIVSLPELETWIETWAFSETIHSRSYTHIIRNIYSDPSKVFDEMLEIKDIVDCADSITEHYDRLIELVNWYNLFGEGSFVVSKSETDKAICKTINKRDIKKQLWLTLMSVNILEGVRFYVSFACSWAFAEVKKMEGNAKIIKLIARDENVHLASTQQMLKFLPKEDPEFAEIRDETAEECKQMFVDAVEQEKRWADYLFKDGSIIGLNAELLKQYVEHIAAKRMASAGIEKVYTQSSNPLPWTQKWIGGGEVQVAPQETEISSYVIGGTKQDVSDDTFKGLSL
jgi:ribonucleoside-diphosphate reductase beta chain